MLSDKKLKAYIKEFDRISRDSSYEKCHIIFHLNSPIILTYPWLNLDGLIKKLFLQKFLSDDYFLLWDKNKSFSSEIFERYGYSTRDKSFVIYKEAGVPYCSSSIFNRDVYYTLTLFKQFEFKYFPWNQRSKRKIYKFTTYYKDYLLRFIYFPISRIEFYCYANRDYLEGFLSNLIGLGKNVRIGWGNISSFKISSTSSGILQQDGKITRPIPNYMLTDYKDSAIMSYRSPYWSSDNIVECGVPFTEATIDEDKLTLI